MTEIQSTIAGAEHVFITPGILSTSKGAVNFCYLCAQTHMDFYENGTSCVRKSQGRGPPSTRRLGVAPSVYRADFSRPGQGGSLRPVLLPGAGAAFSPITARGAASREVDGFISYWLFGGTLIKTCFEHIRIR